MHRRLLRLGLAALAVFISVCAAALGVTGGLAPKGCIADSASNPDLCAKTAHGLGHPEAVAVSPDGRSAYVAGEGANAIITFRRNRKSGALTPAGCIGDKKSNPDGCPKTAAGLNSVDAVAVSPDGRSVYAGGYSSNALVRFNRNTKTGALRPAGCIGLAGANAAHCKSTTKGLYNPESVVVSGDGKFVYDGGDGSAVVVFKRSSTGVLTPEGCVGAADDNFAKCGRTAKGLAGDVNLAITRDGKSLYAVTSTDNAVVTLERNTTTGALTAKGCIAWSGGNPGGCPKLTDQLWYPSAVAVSPHGSSVYVTALNSGSLVILHRNVKTGALAAKGCVSAGGCGQSAKGLAHADAVVVSPDGKSVYTTAFDDNALAIFKRKNSGALVPAGCWSDLLSNPAGCGSTTGGLQGAAGVAVSADGTSLYASGANSNAVVRFKRT